MYLPRNPVRVSNGRHSRMANNYLTRVVSTLTDSRDILNKTLADHSIIAAVSNAAAIVIDALSRQKKILLAGNGGSAADAQHIAGELVSRFNFDREPLAGIALTTDTSILTAIGNDYGYEYIFSRQVSAIGREGDVLIAISTSGRSPNILAACKAAKLKKLKVIGLTGASGGAMSDLCDVLVRVPSDRTPFTQQIHITVGHIICEIAEEALFKGRRTSKERSR
jgi:D-sedoheptulose 7-phosphate isomerase